MLDIGTGSGILAIYGVLLGADKVAAIDIDPEAVRWAERNIDLNELGGRIELSLRPLSEYKECFTIVTANLILGTIIDLSHLFPLVLSDRGRLILSGILRAQVEEAERSLNKNSLYSKHVLYDEEWACIIAGFRD